MFYVFYCILYFVIIRTTYGRGEHRLPVEETNPRQQHYGIELKPRRPAPLAVSTAISFVLSAQCCSAQILDNLNLVTSSGTSHFCETEIEPFPYNVLVNFLLTQNRCRSLRIYVALRDRKAVQIEFSDITFIWYQTFMCFLVLLCTACRLMPIEALPQTPLGTLSLDPAMGFTP